MVGAAGQKAKQPCEVVRTELSRSLGLHQKIHVSAGRLLGGIVLQSLQQRARVRRVDDDQAVHQLGVLVGQVPCHGTAPIVRHQCGKRRACRANLADQGGHVLHQVLGSVGLNVCRGAGAFVAAQIGRHAAVSPVVWVRKMRHQIVPDKRGFWKAVQKQQHRATGLATSAATQGDAVGQVFQPGLDHAKTPVVVGSFGSRRWS